MGQEKGVRLGGRQKGTPNRKTLDLVSILEQENYDPLTELIKSLRAGMPTEEEVANLANVLVELDLGAAEIKDIIKRFRTNGLTERDKAQINLELLSFLYPKRKAVEITENNQFDGPLQFVVQDDLNKAPA